MTVGELIDLLEDTDPGFEVAMETEAGSGHYPVLSLDEVTADGVTYVVLTDFPVDP